MNTLIKLKNIFILFSKLIGLCICTYYIYKVQEYQVSWNLLSLWMMPAWLAYINAVLSTIGTYILIMPMSIIIVSLLIQNTYLNILACLFSISGGMVSLTLSIARGTMLEYTNLKLFVIYHALALDSKREVFINEYRSAMTNISKGMDTKLTYLTDHLDSSYFVVYDEVLKKLPATEIKSYANRVINELLINYENSQPSLFNRVSTVIWNGLTINNIAITIGVIALCIGGYKLIVWLTSNNEGLRTGANIQADAAGVSAQGNVLAGETIQSTKDFVEVFKQLCTTVLKEMPRVLAVHDNKFNQLAISNRELTITCAILANMVEAMRKRLSEQQAELTKLWEFINNLKTND
jgi:hypothetical protein